MAKDKQLAPRDEASQDKNPRCHARLKTCRKCKYRFEAGDKSWECPECGESRQCRNPARLPYHVCKVHGAGTKTAPGGRPSKHGKYAVPAQIAKAYRDVSTSPELLSLSFNIAVSEGRTQDLFDAIHKHSEEYREYLRKTPEFEDIPEDSDLTEFGKLALASAIVRHIHQIDIYMDDMLKALAFVSKAMENEQIAKKDHLSMTYDNDALDNIEHNWNMMLQQLNFEVNQERLWDKVNQQLEITRRMSDTERKWIDMHDQMIPISIVVNTINYVAQQMLEFVHPADRTKASERVRANLPSLEAMMGIRND